MDPSEKGAAKSKRLYAAIATVVVVLVQDYFQIDVDPETIQNIVIAVAALILGDSCRGVGVKATSALPSEPVLAKRMETIESGIDALRQAIGGRGSS